jgi:hypothetical protein
MATMTRTKSTVSKDAAPRKNKQDKTEESDAEADEPKAKKPRCSPEKAQDVYGKMLGEMATNYEIGMTEVPLDTLVVKVGYKHVRSDAILAAKKLMQAGGLAQISGGNCMLTERGRKELVPNVKPADNPEEAWKQFWDHLVVQLSRDSKTASDKAQGSAENMFNLLKDGKSYTSVELLAVTHYGMVRSTGFPEIIKAMKDIKFVEQSNGTYSFTQKMFPFGRPC